MTGSLAWLHRMLHKRPVQARNALSISVKSCMPSSTAPEPAVNGGCCRAIFRLGITSGTPTERGAMTAHGSTLTRSFRDVQAKAGRDPEPSVGIMDSQSVGCPLGVNR